MYNPEKLATLGTQGI